MQSASQLRTAVRPNYILHYIMEGKGKFLVNGEEYNLQKGQGFLIEPEVQTFYQADEEVPWTYLWIGFGGKKAEDYLRDLGLNKKQLIFQCGCGEELKQIVYSMLNIENIQPQMSTFWKVFYIHFLAP